MLERNADKTRIENQTTRISMLESFHKTHTHEHTKHTKNPFKCLKLNCPTECCQPFFNLNWAQHLFCSLALRSDRNVWLFDTFRYGFARFIWVKFRCCCFFLDKKMVKTKWRRCLMVKFPISDEMKTNPTFTKDIASTFCLFPRKIRIDTIMLKMNHRIRGKSLKFKTFWTYVGKIQQLNRLLPRFALCKM